MTKDCSKNETYSGRPPDKPASSMPALQYGGDGREWRRPTTRYTARNPVTTGWAVPIYIPRKNGGFSFDKEALRKVLARNNALDKPLVVVSVAGAFRTGKSFLLNMFLRYMRNEGRGDWLGDAGAPVDGFSCSSGSERHTGGILVWSEVFLVTRPKGGQVAVVLMDTQGTFDTETTFEDVTTIFALSALTSSVQVYNLMSNIREDDLEHLQYFIEYGRMVQNQDSSEKPFQNLVFLVRDWSFVSSYEYGAQGGKKLLNERLKTSGKKQEQKTLRERLKSCFQNMDCFLMPYPGNQVATGQSPEGCLPPMDGTFKPHLQAFVDSSLAADKLVPKRMNGRQLSGREWLTYFSKYAEVFQSGKLPKPKTLLEVTAAANNEAVRNEAKAMYEKGMEEECGENKPFKNKWDMNHLHKAQRKAALDWFTSRPKMGREDVSKVQKEILKKEIEVMRKRFFEANKNKYCKNTVLALSVPGVLTAGGGIVLAFVGGPVGAAATVTSLLIAGTVVGVLHVWTNTVMSGKTTALREGVDNGVDYVCQRLNPSSWKIWCRKETEADIASSVQDDSLSPENENDETSEPVKTARLVQILRTNDTHGLSLDEEALGRILLDDNVKGKPVVVVSVAGAVSTGKSFLLDLLLRYMHTGGHGDWLGDPSVPLGGFCGRDAYDHESTGIFVWDEIFMVTRSNGQQLAVLFMYTDWDFDAIATVENCTKLLALSTMTSSVQVYNLSHNITRRDLKQLLFLEKHGMMGEQGKREEPFQELLFLVRDWSEQCDAGYGAEGGQAFLQRRLQELEEQERKLKHLQMKIWSCFKKIRCFLMPHPCSEVATTPSFNGPSTDVEFKKQLQALSSSILAHDKLLVKEINGKEITCQELMSYFQVYVNAFKVHTLEGRESKFEVIEELDTLVAAATADYTSAMEKLCGEDNAYLSQTTLESHHRRQRESARKWFSDRIGRPGEEVPQRSLDALTQVIDQMFETFAMRNKKKMALATVRTQATLCATVLAFYLLSGTLALLGVGSIANYCKVLVGLSFIGLFLWSYNQLTGSMPDAGNLIDNIVAIIWASMGRLWALYKSVKAHRVLRPANTMARPGSNKQPRQPQAHCQVNGQRQE